MSEWRGAVTQSVEHTAGDGSPAGAIPRPVGAPSRPPQRSFIREIIETALLTLVIFVTVRAMVLNFKVDGLSMAPTLQHGQYLLVNRAIYFSLDADLVQRVWSAAPTVGDQVYLFHPPQRGEIVVLWPPSSSDRPYIKRVIGLPGETVAIRGGVVTINGVPLDEPYIKAPPAYTMAPRRIGPTEYFVLGDNRNNSSDSHLFGTVPAGHIVGKAWLSYWPVPQVGLLPDATYAAPVKK
jgi:signal peptidase I